MLAKRHEESFGNEEIVCILIEGAISWVYVTVKLVVFNTSKRSSLLQIKYFSSS